MKKMFAVLAASTMLVPAIASAQDAMADATRRGVCGEGVTPLAAEYNQTDAGTVLRVRCTAGGGWTGTTLTPAAAGGVVAGAVLLGAALSDDDESGTTTTTTD